MSISGSSATIISLGHLAGSTMTQGLSTATGNPSGVTLYVRGNGTIRTADEGSSGRNKCELRMRDTEGSGTRFLWCRVFSDVTNDGSIVNNALEILKTGVTNSDGAYNATGADYAEYFEWSDGNSLNEDRRGCTVVLTGNKIRLATESDPANQIIGIISSTPVVTGGSAWNHWTEKFLKDDYGEKLTETIDLWKWTDNDGIEHAYEANNVPNEVTVPENKVVEQVEIYQLNPSYDPNLEYIPRNERVEWDPVGMVGKLILRKGQPTGDRWVKLEDLTESTELWLVR